MESLGESAIMLTQELLLESGFKSNEKSPFEFLRMPYYVKKGICLFYNTPVQIGEENTFLVGYAEMRGGKYHATTFRWIRTLDELERIYDAVLGRIFLLDAQDKEN